MPIGCISNVAPTVWDIVLNFPATVSVLDLGCGFGIYGAAIRQWRNAGVTREATIVGVEGWVKYQNPCWGHYNAIHNCTIDEYFKVRNKGQKFDVVLLNDVLEHFDKPAGAALLDKCKAALNTPGRFYVTTPGIWMPQEACYGNELERHRSLWTSEDLVDRGFKIIEHGRPFDGKTKDFLGNQMLSGVFVKGT